MSDKITSKMVKIQAKEALTQAKLLMKEIEKQVKLQVNEALTQAKLRVKEEVKQVKLQVKEEAKQVKLQVKEEAKQVKLQVKEEEKQAKEEAKQAKDQMNLFKKCLKQLVTIPKFYIDGRHIARANETIRIKKLVKMLDPANPIGEKLRNDYEAKFNKQITTIEEAGTNKDHYDLVIHHTDGSFHRVEEKHSEKNLNVYDVPWKDSVQVLNGVGSQFLVGWVMAKLWYDEVIVPTNWNDILQCSDVPEIPVYDEWVKDAFRCGDPKTPFVQKIKSRCRELWGGKSSFTGMNNTPDLRSTLPNFTLTDDETKIFIQQIKDKLNDVLSQKDCFLQTKGDIDTDEFEFAWRESVASPNITSINIRREKDIFIDLFDDENEGFTGILRWGKGCGFTNIRFDVR
jgi:ubiquitin